MNDLFPVKVECYSGYKLDEYPVRFYWNNSRFEIEEILDRWYQYNKDSEFAPANYFKVRTTDNKIRILKQEAANDCWFLWVKGESLNL